MISWKRYISFRVLTVPLFSEIKENMKRYMSMTTVSLQLPNRLLKFEHIDLKKKTCFNPIEF